MQGRALYQPLNGTLGGRTPKDFLSQNHNNLMKLRGPSGVGVAGKRVPRYGGTCVSPPTLLPLDSEFRLGPSARHLLSHTKGSLPHPPPPPNSGVNRLLR